MNAELLISAMIKLFIGLAGCFVCSMFSLEYYFKKYGLKRSQLLDYLENGKDFFSLIFSLLLRHNPTESDDFLGIEDNLDIRIVFAVPIF